MKRRIVGGRRPHKAILVVCEGEKTEPSYFRAFRLPSVEVVGAGKNTVGVVEEAESRQRGGGYEQIWCVFDRDSFPAQHFNAAIEKAKRAGFGVAYSNEAFEIWYLLHFDFHTSALSRTLYRDMLSKRLGHPYQKNDPTLFEALRARQATGIANARRLLATYPQHNPEKDNPCTTVHLLVEELLALDRH